MNDDKQLVTPTIAPQNINPLQPDTIPPPSPILPPQPKKSIKKLVTLIAIALLLVGTIGASYQFLYKKTDKKSNENSSTTFARAKPQYSIGGSVAGYVNYNPTKFKELTELEFPEIEKTEPDVNVIIVTGNGLGFEGGGLFLYDFTVNKAYQLTEGGGDPRIMSDHFLAYGFDEEKDGKKLLSAKLLNLNTGEEKTVFGAAPEDVSGTVCCSVSPDGFKLVYVQKNKISVWDIRTNGTKDYDATVNPVSDGFSREGAPYNVEMSYAQPVWADNNRLIYADKPATKTVMVGASATKPRVDTNIYLLNLESSKSSELPTEDSGIYDIYVRGDTVFLNEILDDVSPSQISSFKLSSSNKPERVTYNAGFVTISPKGDKIYSFSSLNSGGAYIVTNTETMEEGIFTPIPKDLSKVSQVIPKGFAGVDRLIIELRYVEGNPSREYVGVYNTLKDEVEQYTQIACSDFLNDSIDSCKEN